MILNFKFPLTVIAILLFTTFTLHAQSRDSLKTATVQEKSEAIRLRMERELSLTKEQSAQLMKLLAERFRDMERTGATKASLETANSKASVKLSTILTKEQYSLYRELREKKKQDKEKFLKDHPGFAFSKEDVEMDF